jgi:hypothetical protein
MTYQITKAMGQTTSSKRFIERNRESSSLASFNDILQINSLVCRSLSPLHPYALQMDTQENDSAHGV